MSRDFLLQVFFHESPSPKPLIITLGSNSNFFENSRKYSQVKVHHWCQWHRWQIFHQCQWHRWQIAAGINDTGGKFTTGINDTGSKFCHQFPLCCWLRWQICHRCQRYRRQIMGTISGCRHLKVNLKAKIYIYVSVLPKGDQIKLLKFFWSKIFSISHRCRWHWWQTFTANISVNFWKNSKRS